MFVQKRVKMSLVKKQNAYKRKKQVADKLIAIIATAIRQRAADPRLAALTITDVDVSPDLKTARVYYVLPSDPATVINNIQADNSNDKELDYPAEVKKALKKAAGFLQSEVAARTNLRYTPKLIFKLDDFTESSIHLSRILDKISD